jgi:hypothetical protein
MKKRRLNKITIIFLGILTGALTNVATGVLPDMLPAEWKGYLWLSWVPLVVCIVLVLVIEWRARQDQAITPSDSIAGDKVQGDKINGDKVDGDKIDASGAQGVVNRPSAPVAQTNVTNSGEG